MAHLRWYKFEASQPKRKNFKYNIISGESYWDENKVKLNNEGVHWSKIDYCWMNPSPLTLAYRQCMNYFLMVEKYLIKEKK